MNTKKVNIKTLFIYLKKSFIDEYLETKTTIAKDHNIDSKMEALWNLVSQILDLFERSSLNFDHDLLKRVPEITKNGCELLFS